MRARFIIIALLLVALASSVAAEVQQVPGPKAAKIGILIGGTLSSPAVLIEPSRRLSSNWDGSRDRISRYSFVPRRDITSGCRRWHANSETLGST